MEKILKIAVITNTLAPYRVPVFARIAREEGMLLRVICCSKLEPNRLWDLPTIDFECVILHQRMMEWDGRYIHNNPDVIPALKAFSPDIIITDGMNPTHLYAFFYARLQGHSTRLHDRRHIHLGENTDHLPSPVTSLYLFKI